MLPSARSIPLDQRLLGSKKCIIQALIRRAFFPPIPSFHPRLDTNPGRDPLRLTEVDSHLERLARPRSKTTTIELGSLQSRNMMAAVRMAVQTSLPPPQALASGMLPPSEVTTGV